MIHAGALVHPHETLQILFSLRKTQKNLYKTQLSFLTCIRHLMRHLSALLVDEAALPCSQVLICAARWYAGHNAPVKQIIASRATQENNALNGVLLPRLALDDAAKAPGW